MAGHRLQINGHPTWVDDRPSAGDGGTLLVLHGGLSCSDTLLDVRSLLEPEHRVVAFDRRGHGYTADTDQPFHYEDMATETIGVLEAVIGGPASLVGYSDGGIVGLLVAMRRPDLVERLVVIGANFHHEGVHPLELDPESDMLAAVVAEYVERSPDGADHFGETADKFMTMATTEPTMVAADLALVTAPTLVIAGDDDLVKLSHTVELYEALPVAQLAIVPGASHGLPLERPAVVCDIIESFLRGAAVPATLLPVRRRS